MILTDTICAAATPQGRSALAIVRLSGQDSWDVFNKLAARSEEKTTPRNIRRFSLTHPVSQETIDDVCCVYYEAPASFTGENMVEVFTHGNPLIVQQVLEALVKAGARMAQPGEFTSRAFLNGKLDLSQAEAIAQTINATSLLEKKLSLKQLKGNLYSLTLEIKEELIKTLSHLEAGLDFQTEGDVASHENIENEVQERIKNIMGRVEKLRSSYQERMKIVNGLRAAFVGSPNVGKSSLFNAFLNESRSIVSETGGTTRDTINETIWLNGSAVELVDTAGLRDSTHEVEKEGIARAESAAHNADMVFFVLDGSRPVNKDDQEALKYVDKNKTTFYLINKCDLELKTDVTHLRGHVSSEKIFFVSAKNGTGLDAIKKELLSVVSASFSYDGEVCIAQPRHFEIYTRVLHGLNKAYKGCCAKIAPEYSAQDISETLEILGEITGETTPEDIIQKIFSEFCIGK